MKMTLKIRRVLLNILLFPSMLALVTASFSWIGFFRGQYPGNYSAPAITTSWWGFYRSGNSSDLLWGMAGLSFLVLFPLISEIILRRRFGRSPSSEMFFLRFFLLTLPIQALRMVLPLALSGMTDAIWADSLTRIAWFGRILGVISLMNIGLYAGEIPFRRSGAIIGTGALAAMAIAVTIPLDSTQALGNLLIRSGAITALSLICLTLEIMAVITILVTAVSQNKRRYFLLAFFMLLVVAGIDLAFFVSAPLLIPGAVLLIIGSIGFAREIRSIYLWV